jgi:putative hemolysin
MESARQLSKHLRLIAYVSTAALLILHAAGGTRLVEVFSPDSFLPVISYLPALPVTISAASLMLLLAPKHSLRFAAIALAMMHYLVCGDYSGRSIVNRIEIEQKAVAAAVNSQMNMPLRIAAANVQYLHQGPTKVGSMLEQLNVDVWLLSEFETTAHPLGCKAVWLQQIAPPHSHHCLIAPRLAYCADRGGRLSHSLRKKNCRQSMQKRFSDRMSA